jgi:ABC-type phosphate transport system substrate-binding protein
MRTKLKAVSASALLIATSMAAHAGAVVVGKDSPIGTMDADAAKRVFMGRDTNLNGANIVVLYQKDETTRTAFETKVLGKTGSDLSAYWAKLIFTGKASAPDEVAGGDAAVRAKLAGNPNAVGYVTDGGVDSTVKVIYKY